MALTEGGREVGGRRTPRFRNKMICIKSPLHSVTSDMMLFVTASLDGLKSNEMNQNDDNGKHRWP